MDISTSEMTSFKRCRRQWMLGTYRALRPIEDKFYGAQHIGNIVHDILSLHYSPEDSYPLEDAYNEVMYRERQIVPIEQLDDWSKDVELIQIMIEGYRQWLEEEGADQDFRFVAAERAIKAPLNEDFNLIGKLDAIVARHSDDRAVLFMDHKTTASFEDFKKNGHMAEQFLTYMLLQYLEQHMVVTSDQPPLRADGGIYNMLRKVKRSARAKPPFYDRHEVRHNVQELRSYWMRVLGTCMDIQRTRERLDNGEDHRVVAYPTPTKNCSWDCSFFSICPMFDDGSDVEGLIPLMYKTGDPLERYKMLPTSVVSSDSISD
jgi:hypothetical protein